MSMFRNALPLFVAAATAAAASPSFADTHYTLTNPGDWGNATDNEVPPVGDSTKSTVGSGSWKTNSAATTGPGQHLIYFQGGTDSQDPNVADPTGSPNPQLLFDSSHANDSADTQVQIGQILRMSWDTNKSSESTNGGHWFVNATTREDTNVTFNFTNQSPDSGNYTADEWNTLEANRDGNQADSLEVEVYTYEDLKSVNGLDSTNSMIFSDWANAANNDNAPSWWDEEIKYLDVGTGTGYNDDNDTFISNLDNFQFSYDTGEVSNVVTLDLEATAVPTPTAGVLGLVGFGLLALRRRRRGESV